MLTWLTNGTSTDDFDTPCDDENDLRAIQKCKRRNSDELKRLSILEDSSRADLNMNDKQNNHNHDGDQQMESLPIHEREIPGIHRNGNESDLLHDLSSTRDSAILPDHPSTWPQRPLMVRPTVTSQTKIKGIVSTITVCFLVSQSYIWYLFLLKHIPKFSSRTASGKQKRISRPRWLF